MINVVMQFVHHAIGAILALTAKPNGTDCWFRKGFHFLATSLVFPVNMTVVTLFWGLTLVNPIGLLAENTEHMLSDPWYNHSIHTVPMFAMIFDFLTWKHPQPRICSAIKTIIAFFVFCLINIHLFYYYTNFWAYPILGQLDSIQRVLFFAGCLSAFLITFFAGYILNSNIGPVKSATPKPQKKQN